MDPTEGARDNPGHSAGHDGTLAGGDLSGGDLSGGDTPALSRYDDPAPSRFDDPAHQPWGPALLLATVFVGVGGVGAVLIPRLAGGRGDAPPAALLLSVGITLTLITAGALYWALRGSRRLPLKLAAFTLAYNVLIVGVKFVVAPLQVYEANRRQPFSSLIWDAPEIALAIIAGTVFLLYAGVLALVYRHFRRKLVPSPGGGGKRLLRRGAVVAGVAGVIVLVSGGSALIVLLLVAAPSLEYLGFVLSTGMSLVVVTALALAMLLATRAFASVTEQARLLRDASVIATFFWFGVGLLAVYHLLWVVYMLILVTVWPLRIVTPK